MTDIAKKNLFEMEAELVELLERAADGGGQDDTLQALVHQQVVDVRSKRDRVAAFLRTTDAYKQHLLDESERLVAKAHRLELAQERLEEYVVRVMNFMDTKRLEGDTYSFQLVKNPSRVVVTDVHALPISCTREHKTTVADKGAIRATIEAGAEVPGAHIEPGQYRLEIR